MYNSVNRVVVKVLKYRFIGLKKKDLIWAVFERCDSIENIQRGIKS